MKRITFYGLLIGISTVSCIDESKDVTPIINTNESIFQKPAHFPEPVYDLSQNPVTVEGFELGRELFYDGILSRDGSISCGECHQQSSGFTHHGHDVSHGIDDKLTLRNAQSIQNLAWSENFFWDGGVFHLDLFAVAPIENPNEMDERLPNVLQKLRNDAIYPQLFKKAFGDSEITTERFLKALAQFQLLCISANSRYDKYITNQGETFSALELKGLNLFEEKCSSCHAGVLQTDQSFRNNGLAIGNPNDTGRHRVTQREEDKFLFKVPSLRNVEFTSPYMHDGRFATLKQVLDHYSDGIVDSPTLDPSLKANKKIDLSENDKEALIAFLLTLTDHEFLTKKELSEFH